MKATSASFPNGLPELRSEDEVRAARLPGSLVELKKAADRAHDAYHGHKYTGDPADTTMKVLFDIEEKRLMRASSAAERAYNDALSAHIEEPA